MGKWIALCLFLLDVLHVRDVLGKEGTIVNPFTDVCWECLFPLTVSGVNVTPGSHGQTNDDQIVCSCIDHPPKFGIPITFSEPCYLIDVTRHAYKLIGLGGVSIGDENIKNRGAVRVNTDGLTSQSFSHVHFYSFPLLKILEIFTDFKCVDSGEIDVGYISELDPMWSDDRLSFISNAEAGIFGNPLAHLACVADCASANVSRPMDKLFWCAGCEGSLYPFTGTISHHVGAVQASVLRVHRIIAKLHRSYLLRGFEKDEYCEAKFMPIIKKSMYKTQLVHPIPQTSGSCPCLGKSDIFWGAGKSYPIGGEDFVYLIWKRKHCCLDVGTKIVLNGVF